MSFLKKHVLFPQRFGIAPYFWLVFLVPVVLSLLPLDSWDNWLFLLLLLVFLKAYRDGYEVQRTLTIDIWVQLFIACLFGIFQDTGYLFIFTAWEIGSLPVTRKIFRQYLLEYYASAAFSLISMVMTADLSDSAIILSIAITMIAAIGSPLAAKAMSESYRKVAHLSQQNKRLEAIIRQNERDRIARDLHDNLGQAFSLITLKAELADKLLTIDLPRAQQELADIAKTSRCNLTLVRGIVTDLQGRTIADTMLEEEKNLDVVNIRLRTAGEELAEKWPITIQKTASAVIKEAVTNMIRHSQAGLAAISFSEQKDCYVVKIKDNGQGFDQTRAGANGLTGMKQRIESEEGIFKISGEHGTEIVFSLPKERVND